MRKTLWLINIIGGISVLGSYAWGLTTQPDPMRLWGQISPSVQGPYSACMPFAALGYLIVLAYTHIRPHRRMIMAMTVMLLFSTIWMPLCFAVLDHGWHTAGVQGVLAATAVASLMMLVHAATDPVRDRLRIAACVGATAFCVQTVLLDAIIWPRFFP